MFQRWDLKIGQMDMCERQFASFMLEGPNDFLQRSRIRTTGAMQKRKVDYSRADWGYKTSTGKTFLIFFDPSPLERGD